MFRVQHGQSPLLLASEQGHLEIVKILLNHHARVDVFDEVSLVALIHTAQLAYIPQIRNINW
jgi:ankyrin repeat protein